MWLIRVMAKWRAIQNKTPGRLLSAKTAVSAANIVGADQEAGLN